MGVPTQPAWVQGGAVQLELLTGNYDPHSRGLPMLFAVLAVAAQLDRDHIREKTFEGQEAAAARGNRAEVGRAYLIPDSPG
ncbi:recombinase family protein [Amycolatopsis sp. NPDC023774]|uniref:recombinase family protein n=1 Tax=Amycolatopsis sp. NPDC023774 TaxID=3155015 RepID=UPI0033F6B4B4